MTTLVQERPGPTAGTGPAVENRPPRPSPARLTGVELRKLVDTRAGRWLLITIAAACAVVVVAQLATVDDAALTFEVFLLGAVQPAAVLLPVLGILAVTSEWSQRTALTTFTLVPGRGRVMVAKLLAGLVTAVASVVAVMAVAAVANVAGIVTGGDGDWRVGAALLGNLVIYQVLNIGMGLAFGAVLLNSPVAIVLYFALPTAWAILGSLVSWLDTAARWLDFSRTMQPLIVTDVLTGEEWARLGTSAAVWVLLPLLIGTVRVLRSEVS